MALMRKMCSCFKSYWPDQILWLLTGLNEWLAEGDGAEVLGLNRDWQPIRWGVNRSDAPYLRMMTRLLLFA